MCSLLSTCADCCVEQAQAGNVSLKPCPSWCDTCAQTHHTNPDGRPCGTCADAGHKILNPLQRKCGRRTATTRIKPVLLASDSCGTNLVAMKRLLECTEHWMCPPIPDALHLLKSVFTSQVNWWLMVDGDVTSQLVFHALYLSKGALGVAAREILTMRDIRAKDRHDVAHTARFASMSAPFQNFDHDAIIVAAVVCPSAFHWAANREFHGVRAIAVQDPTR